MKRALAFALCGLLVLAPACGVFSPQQRQQAHSVLDGALARGEITQAQHDAASEALDAQPGGINWAGLGTTALSVLLAVLGIPVTVGGSVMATHAVQARTAAKRLIAASRTAAADQKKPG